MTDLKQDARPQLESAITGPNRETWTLHLPSPTHRPARSSGNEKPSSLQRLLLETAPPNDLLLLQKILSLLHLLDLPMVLP